MATRQPIVDWDKVRALKPDLYEGTPYQVAPDPEAAARNKAPPQLLGVDPKKKDAPAAPRRQAPPEAVARKPAPAQEAAVPGPPPAQTAATVGVPAVQRVSSVSRETPAPAERVPPEQDNVAFDYLEQVDAAERELMSRGRTAEAATVRQEFNRLIDGQYRTLETLYKTKTLPQVQAMQTELLKFQGQQLPRELAIKARNTTLQAAEQHRAMLAFMYGLARNDATKGLGIKYFNESELIEPGVQLADLVVDQQSGMLIGVDAQGQIVKLSSGEDFRIPMTDAEALYKQVYESDRKDNIILPEGAKLISSVSGKTIATNPKDRVGTPENQLSATKQAYAALAENLGIDLTDMGRMIEGIKPETRDEHTRLMAKAGALIREGMPWEEAVATVMQGRQSGQAPTQGGSAYTGPAPWR